jgi:small subunit ribosomal protein S8
MSIDSIGNFLTVLRNGIMASKSSVVAPYSGMRHTIATLLKEKGFIKDVSIVEDEQGKKSLKVAFKYVDSESVIHEIKRISTPGCRVYAGIRNIKPVIGGLGITILSTNRGIITHDQAKALNVGGEVICTIW